MGGTSDVICDELPSFHIEVKGTASFTLPKNTLLKWYNQISADCLDKIPVIFNKADRYDMVAAIRISDWEKLINPNSKVITNVKEYTVELECGASTSPAFELWRYNTTNYLNGIYLEGLPSVKVEEVTYLSLFEVDEGSAFLFMDALLFIKFAKDYERYKEL